MANISVLYVENAELGGLMRRIFGIGISCLLLATFLILPACGQTTSTNSTAAEDTELTTSSTQSANSETAVAANQQQILDATVLSLQAQGVPVKFVQFANDNQFTPSFIVEFILHSASSNDKGTPDDPIYINLIRHEVDLALGRGLNIGAFEVTLVNIKGIVLGQVINAANSSDSIIPPKTLPNAIGETASYAFLNQNMSFDSMKLINMELAMDQEGLLGLTVNLQVPDLQTANEGINGVYYSVLNTISNFNTSQSTEIAYYYINIYTSSGDVLLKYINDLETKSQNWWMADGLEGDWYFVPPPA